MNNFQKLDNLLNPYSDLNRTLLEEQSLALRIGFKIPYSYLLKNHLKPQPVGDYFEENFHCIFNSRLRIVNPEIVYSDNRYGYQLFCFKSDRFEIDFILDKQVVATLSLDPSELSVLTTFTHGKVLTAIHKYRQQEQNLILHIRLSEESFQERWRNFDHNFGKNPLALVTETLKPANLLDPLIQELSTNSDPELIPYATSRLNLWLDLAPEAVEGSKKALQKQDWVALTQSLLNFPSQNFGLSDRMFILHKLPAAFNFSTWTHFSPLTLFQQEQKFLMETQAEIEFFRNLQKTWTETI